MKAKTKIDMGMNLKKKKTTRKKATKKRILPIAKRGGALPFLPMLGALFDRWSGQRGESAKALNDSKAARRQLEELQHHNRTMQSRGLYLAPLQIRARTVFRLKHGHGVAAKKKKCRKDNKNAVWCNYQCAIERAREMYARIIL